MAEAYNLAERARRALVEAGFVPEFPASAAAEVRRAEKIQPRATLDLAHLLWSSIDNEESRDLDQVEYAEPGSNDAIRLMLAIADVASYVEKGSAIDERAAQNTVSVYTAGKTFHLLPEGLSTNRTSLNEGETRLAVVVEMLVEKDGGVREPRVYQALVKNHAKLTYERVGDWLEKGRSIPEVDDLPGLRNQLELQAEVSDRLMTLRCKMGALTFSSYEARPIMRNGEVVDLRVTHQNLARDLIESFMVAANVAVATFLKSKGLPIIERAVSAPQRWDRIRQIAANYGTELPPEPAPKPLSDFLRERRTQDPAEFQDLSLTIVKLMGPGEYVVEHPTGPQTSHFGLALDDYSHSTAPNRRFADLVIQRLLFAALNNIPRPYSDSELDQIAKHCTEREDSARKVERLMRKIAAAHVVRDRIGETFPAIVTGASHKGTFVRLKAPAVEGKVLRGERGMDVGERVRVRLIGVDAERGFIDFEGA
ncbi:MAG TPA: RNB domain-containing ribonuclease [Verrucomicrobiae bacterium]